MTIRSIVSSQGNDPDGGAIEAVTIPPWFLSRRLSGVSRGVFERQEILLEMLL
jgi:hypothetical protein